MTDFANIRISRQQARDFDRQAIDTLGVPGIVLMENAAINAANAILDLLHEPFDFDLDQADVQVIAGGGNNGGDGYAIARHLYNWNINVSVTALKPVAELKGDAATNANIVQNLGIPIYHLDDTAELADHVDRWQKANILIDAILGTGFTGDVRQREADIIQAINAFHDRPGRPQIVAIDIPSGLDCNTGQCANATIRADLTVTFIAPKTGFFAENAGQFTGRVVAADIGIPIRCLDHIQNT